MVILDNSGFISIKHGRYGPALKRWTCGRYKIHNYGDLLKMGLTSIPDRVQLNNEKEDEIDRHIVQVLNKPDDFSPCLFKGVAAKMFIEYCVITEQNLIFTVKNIKDMETILEEYGGIMDFSGRIFILHLFDTTAGIEELLSIFLYNSKLPVIVVFEGEIDNNAVKKQLKMVYY